MKSIEITNSVFRNPVFRIISDQNSHTVGRTLREALREGWLPVGGMAQSGREWVQVMMKESVPVEQDEEPYPPKRSRLRKGDEALGKILGDG